MRFARGATASTTATTCAARTTGSCACTATTRSAATTCSAARAALLRLHLIARLVATTRTELARA
ncbi:MAG: hypothetical protein QM831_02480 [Kofleriaceae bacterium]